MSPVLRTTLAVLAGIAVAFIVVAGIEAVGHRVYPVPPDMDFADPEQVRRMLADLPVGALLFVLAAWVVATFVGAVVAGWIAPSRRRLTAGIVGGVMLAAVGANLVMIPHPVWFTVVAVVGVLLAAFAAARLTLPGRPSPPHA